MDTTTTTLATYARRVRCGQRVIINGEAGTVQSVAHHGTRRVLLTWVDGQHFVHTTGYGANDAVQVAV